ncbi:MAG TPA: TIGR00282 family metallophosphoesterase [candidate division Zixibacteria bacterium]|nr:TIGR00282 family metallophosphoesterase [candidate division Zixibacteria bacterium]
MTAEMARKVFAYGVNVQTSGNHIWDRYDIIRYLNENPRMLRPANFPEGVPGRGCSVDRVDGVTIAVINLMGRTYMKDIDCPFQVARRLVEEVRRETSVIIVDMHAEATSEKQAMLYWLDGKVSAVIGTHTHVATADEQVTPKGTAYITDVGMTGPYDSIIGMDKEPSLERFLTGMPKRFNTAEGDCRLAGAVLTIESETGRAHRIERIMYPFDIATFRPTDIAPADGTEDAAPEEEFDNEADGEEV